MTNQINRFHLPPIVFIITITLVSLFLGFGIANVKLLPGLTIGAAICIFFISLWNIEISFYILIFAMLLSPEFIVAELGKHGAAATRGLTLRLDDLLILLILLSWFIRTAIFKDIGLFIKTPLNRPIGFYILVNIFSTIIALLFGKVEFILSSLYLLKYIEYFILYFMVANFLREKAQARRLVMASFITCLLVCAYAIAYIPTGERVTAPFEGQGEANTLGGYLLLLMSLVIGLLTQYRGWRERTFFIAFLGVIILPFIATLSRSSWIGLLPLLTVLFIFSKRKLNLSIIYLLFFVIFIFLSPKVVINRLSSTFEADRYYPETQKVMGIGFDPSASDRIARFKISLKNWSKYPILGAGVTGGGLIDGQYFRILEETGSLGLIIFGWLIYSIFINAYAVFKRLEEPFLKGISLGLIIGLSGLLAHSIGTSTFILVRIMEPFWFFVAIVIMSPNLSEKVQPT